MGRIVLSLTTDVGWGNMYQLLGLWRPETIEEAIEIIDELYRKYDGKEHWDCMRYGPLVFECKDREDPSKTLSATWLPESMQDIEKLIEHARRVLGGG